MMKSFLSWYIYQERQYQGNNLTSAVIIVNDSMIQKG